MNINVHQKFTRKEIDIVKELGGFCYAKIKSIHKFIIICQNIKQQIAIEIDEFDEFDYKDRDLKYEQFMFM